MAAYFPNMYPSSTENRQTFFRNLQYLKSQPLKLLAQFTCTDCRKQLDTDLLYFFVKNIK
jgi:hypothetical protein